MRMRPSDSSAVRGRPAGRALVKGRPSSRSRRTLPRGFYARGTLVVARELLGKVLSHNASEGRTAGLIVEVEAYVGEDDPACHAAPGPTPRNAPLYGAPGNAYVYLNYGLHYLVNAVTEPAGRPAAVLIRALKPLDGLPLMRRRRARGAPSGKVPPDHHLCRGPGNLARALGITLDENRADLCRSWLRIEDHGHVVADVGWSPRVGVRVGTDRPWRCFIQGHACVSRLPSFL